MQQPKTKTALLETLRREKTFWEALMAVVAEEDMLAPGVTGDWTFKDVVAHLTAWRKRTLARFEGARRGSKPPPPEWPAELGDDTQAINDWLYRQSRERTLVEVLEGSRRVWQELVDAVEALPEAVLMEPGRFEWLEGRALGPANLSWSFAHLHEHAAQINDWLARMFDAV